MYFSIVNATITQSLIATYNFILEIKMYEFICFLKFLPNICTKEYLKYYDNTSHYNECIFKEL